MAEIDLDALKSRLRMIRAGMSRSFWSDLLVETAAAIVVEESGYIVDATKPGDLLFGYIPGELAGQSLKTIIPKRFWEIHDQHWKRYWENPIAQAMGARLMEVPDMSGASKRKLDIVGRVKDGTEKNLTIGLYPFKPKETDQRAALALISERF